VANIFSVLGNAAAGAGIGLITGGPAGAVAGGMTSGIGAMTGAGPSGLGNIAPGKDLTLPIAQGMNQAYEGLNLGLQAEQLRHQFVMQEQSQQFNEVQDEKSEQMREMNTLRTVAMKQRESDDKIVKDLSKPPAASDERRRHAGVSGRPAGAPGAGRAAAGRRARVAAARRHRRKRTR